VTSAPLLGTTLRALAATVAGHLLGRPNSRKWLLQWCILSESKRGDLPPPVRRDPWSRPIHRENPRERSHDTMTASISASPHGVAVRRYFTSEGVHPYDEVEWSLFDAVLNDLKRPDVEFPRTWSQNAVNIVAHKYFYGDLDDSTSERSLREVLDRVVDTIVEWGADYFASPVDAETFNHELKHLLVHQMASFNSPVWFNLGVTNRDQQASACFILAVEDDMRSILNWYVEEGLIFKRGSGAGINLSSIRSSMEKLTGGTPASGPVSFMRGADASAGVIKSGASVRKAAKMVILDVDHPDIEEFIWCKKHEEDKQRALAEAGFDMTFDGKDMFSVQYQNANNSVRVTDEFMRAAERDGEWVLRSVTTGEPLKHVRARDLLRQMAESAWHCADPGIQYHSTINRWHTTPNAGAINGSNPCLRRGTRLLTSAGWRAVEDLCSDSVQLFDGVGYALGKVWETGTKPIVRLETSDGRYVDTTADHQVYTSDGWVSASECLGATIPQIEVLEVAERLPRCSVVAESTVTAVVDLGMEDRVYDFSVPTTNMGLADGVLVHNCSEYMHLDNSACNLVSLNLRKFCEDGQFANADFAHAIDILILAQDIIVGRSSYPTEKIGETARAYRQLGMGYANLGGMLMSLGLPYDSNEGRAWAAAVTALMSGQAYHASTEIAHSQGPFDGYAADSGGMQRILRMHRDALRDIGPEAPQDVVAAAQSAWDSAVDEAELHGVRNAQISLLAPTGTISLMMDCDTLGIEPDLGLIKNKKLVGGGHMRIVNQTVPVALRTLGYDENQVADVLAHVQEHEDMDGAPHVSPAHLPVFDCALGTRSISAMGHVRMLEAVQPFLSGAISKTVGTPNSATVEDIEEIFIEGWKRGLKAVSVYRDGCKVAQPMSTGKKLAQPTQTIDQAVVTRNKLPIERASKTRSFRIGDTKGYLTSGQYADGSVGEIFIKLGKQGSTLSGVLDALAIVTSIALQYGVPLEALVTKLAGMRFEPSGITNDSDLRFATSIVDYIYRRLAALYLPQELRNDIGVYTVADRTEGELEPTPVSVPVAAHGDAPYCAVCGVVMRRSGACFICGDCGSSSGCS
jgi:ribonucleotide reductase alpha subunit